MGIATVILNIQKRQVSICIRQQLELAKKETLTDKRIK
jgi:hypothetical protein